MDYVLREKYRYNGVTGPNYGMFLKELACKTIYKDQILFFYSWEEWENNWGNQPFPDEGMITRCIFLSPGQTMQVTMAICGLCDNFNRRIGRRISYQRMRNQTPKEQHERLFRALPKGCKL
jgi:hypothetical protein